MDNILVIGGSLGGLLAANLLVRSGHQVRVLEKATVSLDGRGAGIVTHKPLIDALTRCGLVFDNTTAAGDALGVAIDKRCALAPDGAVQAEAFMPQVVTSWSRLYALLLSVLPAGAYCGSAAVVDVQQHTTGVSVTCSDGRQFDADLAVASDGIRSSVRQLLIPDVQPVYAGYVAWRGVCDESVLSAHTRETIFENFGFGLSPGEQLIGYPVAGANNAVTPGSRRYNFVWYRPADMRQLNALMTDATGQHFPLGIAPGKVAQHHIDAMRQAAHARLAPQFAEILDKTRQPFLQPIYDCATPAMAFGRVALMGDAAFVARPHVGMGVTKAAEDAMALVRAIAEHGATPAALHAFEAERLPAGLAVVQRARRLGAHLHPDFGATSKPPSAQTVIAETAIDLSDSGVRQRLSDALSS